MARRFVSSDVADVTDSAQNIRTAGYLNGSRVGTVIIFRQPGANIIETVNRIRAQLAVSSRRRFRRASRPPSFWTARPPFAPR